MSFLGNMWDSGSYNTNPFSAHTMTHERYISKDPVQPAGSYTMEGSPLLPIVCMCVCACMYTEV